MVLKGWNQNDTGRLKVTLFEICIFELTKLRLSFYYCMLEIFHSISYNDNIGDGVHQKCFEKLMTPTG